MGQTRFLGPTTLVAIFALVVLAAVCGHPTGNVNTTGAGGSTGSGGDIGSGSGGSTGAGGSGGGEVILPPDGGAGGMVVTAAACPDDPNQQHALPYTPGQVISQAVKDQANAAVQAMTVTQKANQLRGTGQGQYAD